MWCEKFCEKKMLKTWKRWKFKDCFRTLKENKNISLFLKKQNKIFQILTTPLAQKSARILLFFTNLNYKVQLFCTHSTNWHCVVFCPRFKLFCLCFLVLTDLWFWREARRLVVIKCCFFFSRKIYTPYFAVYLNRYKTYRGNNHVPVTYHILKKIEKMFDKYLFITELCVKIMHKLKRSRGFLWFSC